jgi:hypothetical protein
MFVATKFAEAAEERHHRMRIRVEDVRAIFVNENARIVIVVIGIPTDMVALVAYKDALIANPSQSFGQNSSNCRCCSACLSYACGM